MKTHHLLKFKEQERAGKLFYEDQYSNGIYTLKEKSQDHKEYLKLSQFLTNHNNLKSESILEIGSGKGLFKDLFTNYLGMDICISLSRYYDFDNNYVVGSGKDMPFSDNSFEFVFSIQALEHIPDPEKVLGEIRRVLKDESYLYLAPAWQCRTWAAKGFPVRPYSDFSVAGKIIKFSIKIRNNVVWRSIFVFPKRFWQLVKFILKKKNMALKYKKLVPNYKKKWMSDSDAVNSIDPFSVILWFISRGDTCINYNTLKKVFWVRTGALQFKIKKK